MPLANTKANIIAYYDQANIDYRIIWHLDSQMAMHYGFWDEHARTLPRALANENTVLAKLAVITKDDYVLDAGCGIGGSSLFLARTTGCHVTGISLVESQVATAKKTAAKRGLSELANFRVADFTASPFPDATFDVVWALESICYAAEKQDFLDEAFRLLKPGGRLIVADFFKVHDTLQGREKISMDQWLHGWAVESIDKPEDFQAKVKKAGFHEVNSRDFTVAVMPSAAYLYRATTITTPFDWFTRKLRWRNAVNRENFLAARHQYYVLRKGLAQYKVITAVKPS